MTMFLNLQMIFSLNLMQEKQTSCKFTPTKQRLFSSQKLKLVAIKLKTCKESKLLGAFHLSDTINWHNPICDAVVKKTKEHYLFINMLRDKISAAKLKQVYFAYILSHILYSYVI